MCTCVTKYEIIFLLATLYVKIWNAPLVASAIFGCSFHLLTFTVTRRAFRSGVEFNKKKMNNKRK